MNQLPKPLAQSHIWISAVVKAGDKAIDATCGNGHDTLFLAKLVGKQGKVFAIDLQETAVMNTQQLLSINQIDAQSYQLLCGCHGEVLEQIEDKVSVIMFNLGYLPGANKQIITMPTTTIKALDSASLRIELGGLLSIMCYRGHPGGAQESEAVLAWARSLEPSTWSLRLVEEITPDATKPFLIMACKVSD